MKLIDFNQLEYKRIDYENTRKEIETLISRLENSKNFNDFLVAFKEIIKIQNEIEEMYDYADIRNMRNCQDKFFEEEMNYWNIHKTLFDSLFNKFYTTILSSSYQEELRKFVPETFFQIIQYQLKINNNSIHQLEAEEKELEREYRRNLQGKVLYNGEVVNIAKLAGDFKSQDRNVRKQANDLYNLYFYHHSEDLDKIYIDLIKIRKEIAKTLGFTSYPEYSLYKLRRFGYNYQDIKAFRDNIIAYILPIVRNIKDYKKKELELDELTYYDNIFFKESPQPLFQGEELLNKIKDSFKELDPELYELYLNMLNNNYIDLVNRDNKVNFSITNYLSKSALPTITGNFKDNYQDILVTTHEMGHAFQKYNASLMDKDYIISSLLKYPTMEIAEIFSRAMEVISISHLDNLFSKDDYNKYAILVLINIVYQLPYICLIDEFQEKIYTMDNLDSNLLHSTWLDLVKKYELEEENKGNANLDTGGYFYRQNHLYLSPFYYIDYALSSFCAIALANKCEDNLELFKQIGAIASYYPFNELIEKYNMPNPFDKDVVKDIANNLEKQLKILLK